MNKKTSNSRFKSSSNRSKVKSPTRSLNESDRDKILKLVKMNTLESHSSDKRVTPIQKTNERWNSGSLASVSPIRSKNFSVNFGSINELGIFKSKRKIFIQKLLFSAKIDRISA